MPYSLAGAFLLVLALSQESPNALTPAEKADGWILLFDGSSPKGWLEVTGKPFPAHSWRIENECLATVVPADAAGSDAAMSDLRTAQEFGDSYEFQFDWKIAKDGNSGVKYLIQRVDDWTNAKGRQARGRGFEYQLFDDDSDPTHDPRKVTGAIYEAIAPSAHAAKPVGEFNHSLLRLRNGKVEHWLNGVKVVDLALDSAEAKLAMTRAIGRAPKPGAKTLTFLSLQNHGTPVWFRALKVRVLQNETGTASSIR